MAFIDISYQFITNSLMQMIPFIFNKQFFFSLMLEIIYSYVQDGKDSDRSKTVEQTLHNYIFI